MGKMGKTIAGRLFLVGCPRSGTTLLQSMLAAHPQVASFPESHFFEHLAGRPWTRRIGIASRRSKAQLYRFLEVIDREEMRGWVPAIAPFKQQYASAFVRIVDALTEQQGKTWWLEKTPQHLKYIDLIERYVAEPKFIHIIRNGADVVASLYEVTNHHSEKVWGGPSSVDKCIRQWSSAVQMSRSYLKQPNHTFVRYEQLVDDPRTVLLELCESIGLPFDEAMLRDRGAAAKRVIRQDELWKKSVTEQIQNANGKKFYELFDEEQRQYILQQIAGVNLDDLSAHST